jgi:hypothetical protein
LRREFGERPALFVSGYPEPVITEKHRLPPGVPLLSKPFRAEELRTAVADALARADPSKD